jgi:hypothetical protein
MSNDEIVKKKIKLEKIQGKNIAIKNKDKIR